MPASVLRLRIRHRTDSFQCRDPFLRLSIHNPYNPTPNPLSPALTRAPLATEPAFIYRFSALKLSGSVLVHFNTLFYSDELKEYVKLVGQGENNKLKLDWDFPKAHLWKHVGRNIHNKGVAHNYSTCPNEKIHGPLKAAYQDWSNGKDVAGQILRVDHHQLAHKLLRYRIDAEHE
ncbi:hypothetical protein BDN67DRAFT_1014535 [Paxillus ammoniavirescens]|nr:hypothetical protein BDN67DRAFT_1014535 [Paxillus ammoniavirescens]